MTMIFEGQLEIDDKRGVIYFHSSETGQTLLRICSLPKPIPKPSVEIMLDITHGVGTSWDFIAKANAQAAQSLPVIPCPE